MARGRPEKKYEEYGKPNLENIKILRCEGCTLKQIYDYIGIGKDLAIKWRKEHEEFNEAFKTGKDFLKVALETSIFKRGIGYHVEETLTEIKENKDGTKTKYIRKNKKFVYSDKCAVLSLVALGSETTKKWFPKDINTSGEDKLGDYLAKLKEVALKGK